MCRSIVLLYTHHTDHYPPSHIDRDHFTKGSSGDLLGIKLHGDERNEPLHTAVPIRINNCRIHRNTHSTMTTRCTVPCINARRTVLRTETRNIARAGPRTQRPDRKLRRVSPLKESLSIAEQTFGIIRSHQIHSFYNSLHGRGTLSSLPAQRKNNEQPFCLPRCQWTFGGFRLAMVQRLLRYPRSSSMSEQ